MASKDDLEAQFGPGSMAKEDLLTEATSLCRMYGLTAEELFWKWEAFILSATHLHAQASNAINKARVAPSFNLENARELRKEIQMAIKVPAVKQEPGVGTPKPAFKKPPGRGVDSLWVATSVPVRRADLNGRLANLATPTAKHKRPAVNTTPYTGSKPTPRPSHLVKTEFSDEMGTPAKAGPSRFADISAATPTLVKTEFRPPAPSTFESRTNALEVVECLNAHLAAHTPPAATGPRVKLQTTADPKSYNYRYMFEKIMDRSEALDNRIDECAEVLKVAYQLKDDDLGDPSVESQEDMYAVGRICTDVHATKLQDAADRNKTSIWLESSRMMGGGNRMELRFDAEVVVRGSEAADGGASLFPGEILGVKGRNVGGQFFQVSELLMVRWKAQPRDRTDQGQMPPSYLPVSTPQDLYSYQYESTKNSKLSGMPFAVMLACGPFTTEDNLDYAPLDALVEEARVSKPDVLVLVSPRVHLCGRSPTRNSSVHSST
jgi:DNA polymerase alpha subunit B